MSFTLKYNLKEINNIDLNNQPIENRSNTSNYQHCDLKFGDSHISLL